MIASGFTVLLCDAPWVYQNKRTGGSLSSGANQQYQTLSQQDLCELPVADVMSPDSVAFIWATVPLLPEALEVMSAWGYKYKGKINWDKQNFGLGHWFRGDHEDLLYGIRGDVRPFRCQRRNRIVAKAGKHSSKPPETHKLIQLATRNMSGRRLELFARRRVPGWTCLGNEIDGQDIRASLPRLRNAIDSSFLDRRVA